MQCHGGNANDQCMYKVYFLAGLTGLVKATVKAIFPFIFHLIHLAVV